jgi:nucleotide-binding universal stress UspA family protein
MRNLQRLGVGTNFSPESDLAVNAAALLARATRAHVDLIHVVQKPHLYERVLKSQAAGAEDVMAAATRHLQQVSGTPPFRGLAVDAVVRSGTPFAELITCAKELRHDLLVVGARKRQGITDLLLGSTAERVLRKASVPVLLVKRALPERPALIVAPTDFSDASRPALEEAIALARRWGTRLVLLHVIEPIVQTYAWATDLAGGEIYVIEPEELQPEWDALVKSIDLSGVQWEQQTIKGETANTVAATAEGLNADLIVMGTHGRTGLAHALLGSVAEGVARAASTSVLTVRADSTPFALP